MNRPRSTGQWVALAVLSLSLGVVLGWTAAGQQPTSPATDPLPPGAVARLGNSHFWHGAALRALAFAPGERLLASLGQDKRICVWETATGKLVRSLSIPLEPLPVNDKVKGGGKGGKGPSGVMGSATFRGPLLALAADGKLLALADTAARRYRVWDTSTGKELHQVPMPDGTDAEDAAEAEALAAAGLPPSLLGRMGGKFTGPFALSGDGRLLAMGGGKENAVVVWDLHKGAERCRLQGHTGHVMTLAFEPDGKALLSTSADQTLRLWDIQAGKLVRTFWGHRAAVRDAAFLADGRRLLSASADGTLRVWDRDSGKALRQLRWLPAMAAAGSTSPNVQLWHDGGKRVGCLFGFTTDSDPDLLFGSRVTAVMRGHVFVSYDSATGKELSRTPLLPGNQFGTVLALGSKRPLLARATASNHVALCALETGEPLTGRELSGSAVADVALAGTHAAVVQQGNLDIQLWDWRTGRPLHRLEGHMGQPSLARFAGDGRALVSWSAGATDQSVSRWDVAGGQERGRVSVGDPGTTTGRGYPSFVEAVLGYSPAATTTHPEVTPDGRLVALGGRDRMVRVVEIATGKEVAAPDFCLWRGKGYLAFTPDARSLVVCDVNEGNRRVGFGKKNPAKKDVEEPVGTSVRLFDLKSGVLGPKVGGRTYGFLVRRVVVAEGYALLACSDGPIRVLDLTTGEELRTVGEGLPAEGFRDPAEMGGIGPGMLGGGPGGGRVIDNSPQFAVSPDGRTVAVVHPEDNSVRLWELATNGKRAHLQGHAGPITCLRFSTDGRHLVTGSQDGTVLIWAVLAPADRPGTARPELTRQQAQALWADLGADAARAFQANQQLTASPARAVELLRAQLKPEPPVQEQRLRKLLLDLDDRSFSKRDRAVKELTELGEAVMPALRQALQSKPSAEAQQRMEALLKMLRGGTVTGERLREVRAVELLEALGTTEAHALLRQLAGGAPGARLTREAGSALERARLRTPAR